MAGRPKTQERAYQAEARVAELEAELHKLRAALGDKQTEPKRSGEPASLNNRTRHTLIATMLDAADEGTALPEIASQWNVTEDELQRWAEGDVLFGRAVRLARVRGKAAMWRLIRSRLAGGAALPAAFIDRVMSAYDQATDGAGAETLLSLDSDTPSDPVSCPYCGETFEPYAHRQTPPQSDGQAET